MCSKTFYESEGRWMGEEGCLFHLDRYVRAGWCMFKCFLFSTIRLDDYSHRNMRMMRYETDRDNDGGADISPRWYCTLLWLVHWGVHRWSGLSGSAKSMWESIVSCFTGSHDIFAAFILRKLRQFLMPLFMRLWIHRRQRLKRFQNRKIGDKVGYLFAFSDRL